MLSRWLTILLLLTVGMGDATAQLATERTFGCRHVAGSGDDATVQKVYSWQRPSVLLGEKHQMVILVDFTDRKFLAENPLAFWDRVFNEEHFSEGRFVGSVHDYFYDQSYGQFSLWFDLYHVSLNRSYTTYGGAGDSQAGVLLMLLASLVDEYVADWDLYDWNGDEYIDQIIILYAGKGRNAGGDAYTIWPHQWSLTEQGRGQYEFHSRGYRYIIDRYCCVQELDADGGYGSFGTICHEYSHCFGLPDFYYDKSTQVVGSWDVMDYGNNNGRGYSPCNFSAHERWLLGWMEPTELKEAASVVGMRPLSERPEAYLVRNDGHEDEYYIVENRQPVGWDAGLPGSGLLVFHIDYDAGKWTKDYPNGKGTTRYSLFAANDMPSVNNQTGWAYPYGENDALANNTRPTASLHYLNTTSGSMYMSKPITNIRVEEGRASFDFMGGGPVGVATTTATGRDAQVLYDLGEVSIVRMADGSVRKVMKRRK